MDIIGDIKRTFKEGSVLTQLIYVNLGVFLIVKILGVLSCRKKLGFIKSVVGFLPENLPLYKNMRVKEFLNFVGRINGVKAAEIGGRAHEVMDKCGLLEVSNRMIGNLSRGYRQRVGIAQTLVYNPQIVVLDELPLLQEDGSF